MNTEIEIPEELAGVRFDRALAKMLSQYSRARLQQWIRAGDIRLNTAIVPTRQAVQTGDLVQVQVDDSVVSDDSVRPEPIDLNVHYEDESVLVINKPVGLVMHVAPGNYTGTMQNALLHHDPGLAAVPRSGIVHRLDKDTSGLVMVARNLSAHNHLVQQLQERRVHRIYDAVVSGVPVSGSTVDEPIGRHPVDRKRMCVNDAGKPAITHFRLVKKYQRHCHIRVQLETGRTHQIRVHMAHIRYPLVGDAVYAGRGRLPGGVSDELRNAIAAFPRHALHARELGIEHPVTGEYIQWDSDLPADMQQLLVALEAG